MTARRAFRPFVAANLPVLEDGFGQPLACLGKLRSATGNTIKNRTSGAPALMLLIIGAAHTAAHGPHRALPPPAQHPLLSILLRLDRCAKCCHRERIFACYALLLDRSFWSKSIEYNDYKLLAVVGTEDQSASLARVLILTTQ